MCQLHPALASSRGPQARSSKGRAEPLVNGASSGQDRIFCFAVFTTSRWVTLLLRLTAPPSGSTRIQESWQWWYSKHRPGQESCPLWLKEKKKKKKRKSTGIEQTECAMHFFICSYLSLSSSPFLNHPSPVTLHVLSGRIIGSDRYLHTVLNKLFAPTLF